MKQIGVIGAGAMGTGIAQLAATCGHDVIIYDTHNEAIEKSKQGLLKILNRLVEKERITDAEAKAIFGRIHFASSLSAFQKCALVIEAIIERLDIKKEVFKSLETIVSADCILASNTSSLSIASIASACEKSERVIGIHFFNPAPIMKLVEIIPAIQTKASVVTEATQLIDAWGKVTVIAKDTPGFIVNRIARPFYGEALRIYEEGLADFSTIDWALKSVGGFRMGPFQLMDYIGHDVNYAVTESVFTAFYFDPRYKPSFTQKRLAEAGWLGRKSGRGFYHYNKDAEEIEPNKDNELAKIIVDRIILMLINEAADALFLNIATAADIEKAMLFGVNYPKGLLAWANEMGIQKCVDGLDALYSNYHEDRYRCSPLLRKLAKSSEPFTL